MVKIVCFIRKQPVTVYFVNTIHETHKVDLVVIEKPSRLQFIIGLVKFKGLLGAAKTILDRFLFKTWKSELYNQLFSDAWRNLNKDIQVLVVDSVNSSIVCEKIRETQPNLLLVHGTSIVKPEIVNNVKLGLNLHWGLSPYYRGAACTEWALLNWDIYNIGVTIHTLAPEIDGGDIVAQARVDVQPDDTVHSINMRLTYLGTELVTKIMNQIVCGQQLNFVKQDLFLGYLNIKKQFSKHLVKQIEFIEKNGIIKTILKRPSRKEKLPIIMLKD
jgi:folate-dependent phosphoribosylglycinamide formyltransferase PurN